MVLQGKSSAVAAQARAKLGSLDSFSAYTITKAIQRYGQNEQFSFTFLAAKGSNSISEFEPGKAINI